MPGTARLAAALDAGVAAAHEALRGARRGTPRETGLSLHLAAFTAVCLGLRHAYQTEVDFADVQPRFERALRHLGETWDARPAVRRRRSVLAALRHLGTGDPDALPGAVHDSAALAIAVPGTDAPEPGMRADFLVRCYRRYVGTVYCYCCDRRGANTWDDGGHPFALERGLFADLGLAPPPLDEEAGPGVFETVLRASPPTVETPTRGG